MILFFISSNYEKILPLVSNDSCHNEEKGKY